MLSALLTGLAVALLVVAVWRDVATRIIPDEVSAGIAVIGLLVRLQEGWLALAFSASAALVLFLLLFAAHAGGALGGGDVKLAVAVALGLPPLGTWYFLTATALAGGVLALAYLLLGRLLPPLPVAPRATLLRRVASAEAWRARRGGPLPYGVAIAAGAGTVLLASPGS
jgi:prepilin peptidase CpaA